MQNLSSSIYTFIIQMRSYKVRIAILQGKDRKS